MYNMNKQILDYEALGTGVPRPVDTVCTLRSVRPGATYP